MKRIYVIIAVVAAILFSFSCQKVEVSPVIEGQSTEFTLEITTPAPIDLVMTKATDQQETVVENLALLFYKNADSTPIVVRLSNMGTPSGSGTNYVYTVKIKSSDADADGETLLSGTYYLYAVANYNRIGFGGVSIPELKSTTLADLPSVLVRRSQVGKNDLDMNEGALLMSGFYGSDGQVTILGGDATHLTDRVHLRRISAKVKFQLQSGPGVNFEPQSYSIYNYPVKSTLFERQGWQTRNGSASPANGTYPGSIPAVVTSAEDVTSIENIEITNGTFTFYTYENAQVAKSAFPAGMGYVGREKRNADYHTFTYAPDYGTYVVVKGIYSGPISNDPTAAAYNNQVHGDVTYTIHLGDFSAATGDDSNFTVRRNSKQNFSVTVNGVNNIYVEATTSTTSNTENQPGAEGNLVSSPTEMNMTFDAHYGCRLIKIPASISFDKFTVVSKTPVDHNVNYNADYVHSVFSVNVPGDISWVKFVKPTADGGIPEYPGTQNVSMYTDALGLIDDIRNNISSSRDGSFYRLQDGKIVTAAFIDEFVYDALPLADYVNVEDRELVVSGNSDAAVSVDGHSTYYSDAFFTIRQHSIRTMYDLENDDPSYAPFGLELIEETKYNEWKNRKTSTNKGKSGTSEDNGQTNSVQLLDLGNSWASYMHGGELISAAQTSQYVFLTRNRDENGDGIIQPSEVKWYIPAANQGYGIILGRAALESAYPLSKFDNKTYPHDHNNAWYWTSSPAHMHFNPIEMNVYTLITQNSGNSNALGSVVCARTLRNYDQVPTGLLSYDSANRIITASNLNGLAKRGPISGEYLGHWQLDPVNMLPHSFELAEDILKTYDGAIRTGYRFSTMEIRTENLCQNNYSQNPDGSDLGQWRIPNENELLAISQVVPVAELYDKSGVSNRRNVAYELGAKTSINVAFNTTTDVFTFKPVYHMASSSADVLFVTMGISYNVTNTKYSPEGFKSETTQVFYVRCIRDVQSSTVTSAASSGPGDFQSAGEGI